MTSAGTITGPIKILTPVEARWLETCVPMVRAHYRQNGGPMPPVLRDLFVDIEAMAKCVRHLVEQAGGPRETEWIGTAEAARLLHVSDRRVRAMQAWLRHKIVLGKLLFDRDDVLEEAQARVAE